MASTQTVQRRGEAVVLGHRRWMKRSWILLKNLKDCRYVQDQVQPSSPLLLTPVSRYRRTNTVDEWCLPPPPAASKQGWNWNVVAIRD